MQASAHGPGQAAERQQVAGGEAEEGVLGLEPLALSHLGGQLLKLGGKARRVDHRGGQYIKRAGPAEGPASSAQRGQSRSSAVAAKSQTASRPLAWKKAASRRERSPGRTIQC